MRLLITVTMVALGVTGTWAESAPVRSWSDCSKPCGDDGIRTADHNKRWAVPCNQFVCDPVSECPCQDMDILFVLDRSKSIRERNYWIIKQFIMDTVETISRMGGAAGSRVALLSFDYGARTEIGFDDTMTLANLDELKNRLWNLEYAPERKATHTATAFDLADTMLMGRPSAGQNKQIIIVITDGKSTQRGKMPEAIAKLRQDDDRLVFGIGIGESMDIKDIQEYTNSDDMAFLADNFNKLQPIIVSITGSICCKASNMECELTLPTECSVTCGTGIMKTMRECQELDEEGKPTGDVIDASTYEECCTQECIDEMCFPGGGGGNGKGRSRERRDLVTGAQVAVYPLGSEMPMDVMDRTLALVQTEEGYQLKTFVAGTWYVV